MTSSPAYLFLNLDTESMPAAVQLTLTSLLIPVKNPSPPMFFSSRTGSITAWHIGLGQRLHSDITAETRHLEAGSDRDRTYSKMTSCQYQTQRCIFHPLHIQRWTFCSRRLLMSVAAVLQLKSREGANILLHSLGRVCSGKSGKLSILQNTSTWTGEAEMWDQSFHHPSVSKGIT